MVLGRANLALKISLDHNATCRELAMLNRLDHPNVVDLVGWFETSMASVAIVMSAARMNLTQFLVFSEFLLNQTSCKIARDVASGLGYLHTNNIVHLDVKPSNIGVDLDSSGTVLQCKLLDFGSAQSLDCIDHTLRTTSGFMAPELRSGPITAACDIFSAGLVFVILLRNTKDASDPMQRTAAAMVQMDYFSRPTSAEVLAQLDAC